VAAQSVGMAVELPLGGYYRAGSWVPINCALTNQGTAADVAINAQVHEYGPNPVVHPYELSVSLPSPAYRRYFLYLMPPGFMGTRPIEVQLLQDRRVLARQELSLNALNEGDLLVAVVTPQEGGFGGLAGLKVPPGTRPNVGYAGSGYGSGNRPQGQVQLAYVKPELAPDRAIGYQVADMVVVNSLPSAALSPAQEQALTRWVQAGGTLVVTGGADAAALQTPAMRALLPAEVTGTVPLDSASALRALAGSQAVTPPPSPQSQLVVTACRPKAGATVVEVRPGVPILCSWFVGAGKVVFLTADPTRPPLRGWDGITELLRQQLFHPPQATPYLTAIDWGMSGPPAAYGGYNQYGRQPALLSNACLQVSQMGVPGVTFVGLFLVAYIVALVPVNYYLLKRRDRRELAWVTTPLIILAFSGLAYAVGYGTKGGQVVLAQAGVVEASAGQTAAPSLTYLGLFSPGKTRYDLSTEDGTVPLMLAESGDQASHRGARVIEGDAFGLKDVPIDMWDMALFRADNVVELGEGFQSTLHESSGELTGRVTNRTPFDLEDAVLLTGGASPISWGSFRRGDTRSVSGAWNPISSGSLLPPAVVQTVHGTDAVARMRRALMESLTTWSPGSYGATFWSQPRDPILLGWVNRPLIPARVDGHSVRDQATNLFIVHLPVK
jgi:hypothetical protein